MLELEPIMCQCGSDSLERVMDAVNLRCKTCGSTVLIDTSRHVIEADILDSTSENIPYAGENA